MKEKIASRHWKFDKIKNVVDYNRGKKPKDLHPQQNPTDLPYIDIKAFEKNIFKKFANPNNGVICDENNVLVVWDGSRSGLVGIGVHGLIGSTIISLKPRKNIIKKFLYYFLKSKFELLNKNTSGIAIPHVKPSIFWNLEIPLIPIIEQEKIVQKLDHVLEQLEEKKKVILEIIEKKQYNLFQNYESYIDELACFGHLTKDWRKKNPNIENATKLLSKFVKKQNKISSNIISNSIFQNALPQSWTICYLSDITNIKGGIQKTPKRRPVKNFYPYLRVGNVYKNRLNLDRIEYFELTKNELENWALQKNDILVVEGNGSIDQIGRCAIWNDEIKNCVHQNHIIRCRPFAGINSEFIAYFWNSSSGRKFLKDVASTTSGLYTLNISKISKIPIPLPSSLEQDEIVRILHKKRIGMESALSHIQKIKEMRSQIIKNFKILPLQILNEAFAGRLVN